MGACLGRADTLGFYLRSAAVVPFLLPNGTTARKRQKMLASQFATQPSKELTDFPYPLPFLSTEQIDLFK